MSIALVAALLSCLLASPGHGTAHDVIVIKDADIKPYREAIRGFESACGCALKEVELSDAGVLAKIEAARPEAVLAVGTQALRKARELENVPVLYTMVMPSEATALAEDDVSGVSMDVAPETYFAAMAALFPAGKRIGVISDPEHTGPFVEEAAAVARARGITLIVKTIRSPRQAPALLDELRDKIDVLWMLPDATFINAETIDYLMLFSFQNNVPVFTFAKKYVERGAVAALAINPYELGIQTGELAQLLFRGGKAPLRAYAKNPRLIVNMKVAAKLGVKLNGEAIRNAEKVE